MLKTKIKKCVALFATIACLFPLIAHAENNETELDVSGFSTSENLVEKNYQDVLKQWQEKYDRLTEFSQTIEPAEMTSKQSLQTQKEYPHSVRELSQHQEISFKVTVPKKGLYRFMLDYYSLSDSLLNPEFSIKVNHTYPFYESRRIIAPSIWRNRSDKFVKNQKGDDLIPEQKTVSKWSKLLIQDANYFENEGLLFLLNEGENTITLTNTSEKMLLGDFYIVSSQKIPSYQEYQKEHKMRNRNELVIQEAEHPKEKNNSYVRPFADQSSDAVPYNNKEILLNVMGGDSWANSGEKISWEINVPEEGSYQLTLKLKQNIKENAPVFRNILIDNQLLFKELQAYRFEPNNGWENHTLGEKETPFHFALTKGKHLLTMEVTAAPVVDLSTRLGTITNEMNDLGLEIKKLTGNQADSNRDWQLNEYIPDIDQRFSEWHAQLKKVHQELEQVYGTSGKSSQELAQLEIVTSKVEKLGEKIDDLPNRLTDLSEGSSSVTQTLSKLQTMLTFQPLTLDRIYLNGNETKLPDKTKDFVTKVNNNFSKFMQSFSLAEDEASTDNKAVIEVWVARSQQYVELMQNMVDSTFTKETGQKVKFSVMPNEQKLILANSSGQQPDLALGVSVGKPYELAIRGAAVDLTKFADFKEYAKQFSPGAFAPMMIDEKIYALPETQDFYVQFARKDILSKLKMKEPNTWNDVVSMLPELQRYGLNYFVPLSGSAGTKPFMFTAPFIYQFGGDLYTEDGSKTAIDQDNAVAGIQFMTDLYKLYSLPLQVPNFYNSFRYGTLPIGISNFETYVKLRAAAPEIANSWDISLYPGVLQPDGSVSRWATGSAQSAMMFEKSQKQKETWELLKWWMSTKTQSAFAKNLQTIYGPEYMWNTANLEAFAQLPWPEEHKKVILEQWQFLQEVPKTPGSYILEREISNVWTDAVFNGINLRASVDDRVIIINREIRRKLEEFGYMKGDQVLKPYHVPTIKSIEEWLNEEK